MFFVCFNAFIYFLFNLIKSKAPRVQEGFRKLFLMHWDPLQLNINQNGATATHFSPKSLRLPLRMGLARAGY